MILLFFIITLFANEDSYYYGSQDQNNDNIFESSNEVKEKIMPFTEGRDPFYRVLDTFKLGEASYSLEKYSLDEFSLKGVVWSVKSPIAMFQGPDGISYRLKKGDKIGRNNGTIMNIDNGQVEIQEIIAGKEAPTIIKIKKG